MVHCMGRLLILTLLSMIKIHVVFFLIKLDCVSLTTASWNITIHDVGCCVGHLLFEVQLFPVDAQTVFSLKC